MTIVKRAGDDLWYEVTDAVVPWHAHPATIVFHHGVAMSSALWRAWMPGLADRYRIVTFDMRGHGRSARPPKGAAWSMDQLADDLAAVADAAGLERFHLVGESIGGTVALYFALRAPGRLLSVTASNSSPRGLQIKNIAGWRATMTTKGQQAWADEVIARRFHEGQLDAERWDWALRQHLECSGDACVELGELLARADITERLGEIAVPTLLLSPDGSPFIPPAVMTDMAARIPGAELAVFPHARHGLPLSHAAQCAATLRAFLDRRFPAG